MNTKSAYTRPLAPNERVYLLGSVTVWHTVHVEGSVDLAALGGAWGRLRQEHPVLTGHFRYAQHEFLPGIPAVDLVVPAEAETTSIRIREGIDGVAAQRKVFPDEGRFTYPTTDSELSFIDVAPQDGQTLVSFVVSHALGDAKLNAYWNRRLWQHYTDIVEGKISRIEPHPVPQTVQALLAERGLTEPPGAETSRLTKATPIDIDVSSPIAAREWVRLSSESTMNLREKARELGLSVNSLLLGVIAFIERRWLPIPGSDPIDFNLRVLVDLRDRLDPPVPAWGGTNVLGGVDTVVSVGTNSDPLKVGAEAHSQVQEDLQSGIALRDFLRDRRSEFTKDKINVPRSLVTNAGVATPLTVPSGLRVVDYRRWAEQDWSPLAALTGGEAPRTYNCSVHALGTYDGRLGIELGVPQTSEQARVRADELEALLLDIAGR